MVAPAQTTGNARPPLRRTSLDYALSLPRGQALITMSIGQWDTLLAVAYDQGWILLELDDDEFPVAAYQKAS